MILSYLTHRTGKGHDARRGRCIDLAGRHHSDEPKRPWQVAEEMRSEMKNSGNIYRLYTAVIILALWPVIKLVQWIASL